MSSVFFSVLLLLLLTAASASAHTAQASSERSPLNPPTGGASGSVVSEALAQTSSAGGGGAGRVVFTVKGGLGRATLVGDDVDEFDGVLERRTGFTAGVAVDVPVSSSLFLQVEGLAVSKGATLSETFLGERYVETLEIRYLEIPLLLAWRGDRSGGASPFLYGGLAPSFRLKATIRATRPDGSSEAEDYEDVKSLDAGLVIGGGVSFGRFSLEGRLTRGLMSIDGGENDGQVFDVRNTTFTALAGVSFGSR